MLPYPPGEDIRERTDALDAAGNTTAAIGKGFAIGSAALVSLALFGAYVTRSKIDLIESSILDPKVQGFSMGLIVGRVLCVSCVCSSMGKHWGHRGGPVTLSLLLHCCGVLPETGVL